MPLNINNILSSANDKLENLKKTSDINSLINNTTNDSNKNSLLDNFLPTDYIDKLKNSNIDVQNLLTNFDSLSNLNIDKNKLNDDFSKIEKSGIKFTTTSDLKNQDLSKLNLDKNFIQNLNKMENIGLNLVDLFNSFLKLNSIGGPDKLDDLLKKSKDWLNLGKTNSDKTKKVKREKIKLPNPGEVSTITIYEDQLPDLEKVLKKEKFSKLFGDEYKSVLSLISPDSNISTDDSFIGKYIISYFVGNKLDSWDLAQKGAISKITIDQNQISLKCDYNKNVDMVTHHIHIVLLKNINPVDKKLEKDNKTITNFEKNLNIDKERGIKILVPSQYLDVFQTSKWGGYKSFSTTKFSKQLVWYDNSYDRADFYPNNITKPSSINRDGSSNFDIGVHIGQPGGKTVGNWSDDGSHCFATNDGLNEFFELCDKHSKLYGDKFTYTLATKDDFEKAFRDDQIVKEEQRKKDEELARIAAENKAKNEQANTVVNNNTNPVVDTNNNTVSKSDRNDESSCTGHDCWTYFGKESFWNGVSTIGGKKVPEIKIQKSDTQFTISYKGASTGFLLKHANGGKNDTIHQLLNVLTLELNPHLKQYKLKPVIKDIRMDMKSNSLVVTVPLIKSPTGKAFFINRRGGWGHNGDTSGLNEYKTKPNYEGLSTHKSGSLTEHFITFELA
jgi:hypothetical protein